MKFTDIFISRPVLATCLNLFILVAGFQAYQALTVRQYPKTDVAVVTVKTPYIGASANLVRGFVTTPLERVIASADGIEYIESSSVQGLSTIQARLKLNYDVNDALTQIQAKVAQVRNDLPEEAEAPIIDVESADTRFASLYLSFYSDSLQQNEITDYLLRVVQPKLSSIEGVQRADILGSRTFAMRIWLDPDRLAAHGVSPSDVNEALRENNYLSATGTAKGNMVSVNLVTNTDLSSAEEFKDLIVKRDGTSVVRLREVADVVLGAENYDEAVRFDGETAVFMGIWALPNANSIDVIKRVREALPGIETRLPGGLQLGVPYDSTAYINDALNEVTKTLTETVLIVILVIFVFIGSLRAVLVPVVAIPLSLIGATIIIFGMGFSINLLTLLAIVLAVGLVVDDAIVMLENVERHISEGMEPKAAAYVAARELAGPTIAMTLTLAAVYTPIGLQGGLTGALFREFAFTLAGAVLISGVVALTLSPVMSSFLLKKDVEPNAFQKMITKYFDALRTSYTKSLAWALERQPGILTFALMLGLSAGPLYMFSTKELAPREDQGVVFGIVQASPNASLEQTTEFTAMAQDAYEAIPEYARSFQLTTPTGGFSGMLPKPWSERSRNVAEIEQELWGKVGSVPGVRIILITPPPLPGGSDFPIELVINSTVEPDQIVGYAQQLAQAANQSGVFMFADTDLKFDLPQAEIVFDRDKVNSLGLSLRDIGRQVGVLTGGDYTNRFSIQGRSYKVIPQLQRKSRLQPEQILDTFIRLPDDSLVPLSTVATVKHTVEPRQLNRFQQLNSAKIQGAIPPGVTIDQALSVIEAKAKEILPKDFSVDYAGESRQLRVEGNKLTGTLILAFIVIFLVLAAQFESFRDPFIILFGSVPLALTGALTLVFFDFTTLNIYSQVGLVTLVGLVAKNGILIVEFANELQRKGRTKFQAVVESATIRFRPVMMTSVATVCGHFPLVLVSGPGAGARNSIGIVLVTGMAIGTVFTLFVVPAIYLLIATKKEEIEDADTVLDSIAQPA
ncbi:MAG: efflux RND transporter permease subunit [Bdellovibrionales bacterium]|nr:efflux RND transporter permease subunit [Bdellovibrionales bacterium]